MDFRWKTGLQYFLLFEGRWGSVVWPLKKNELVKQKNSSRAKSQRTRRCRSIRSSNKHRRTSRVPGDVWGPRQSDEQNKVQGVVELVLFLGRQVIKCKCM